MNPSVAKPTIYPVYQPWRLQTLQSIAGFVVFHHNSTSKPNHLQEYHIWVCVNLPEKKSQQWNNPYIKQNLELIERILNGIISPGCHGTFSPSAATNQQNGVRDVVQLSQIQIIAISETIQQVHHNN